MFIKFYNTICIMTLTSEIEFGILAFRKKDGFKLSLNLLFSTIFGEVKRKREKIIKKTLS